MALITPTFTELPDQAAFIAQWTMSSSTDVGAAIDRIDYPDRTVQVSGTFGGTIGITGSLEATTTQADAGTGNFKALTDPQGNALSFSTNAIEQVMENTRWIRPEVTAGTPSAVVVTLFGRRAART